MLQFGCELAHTPGRADVVAASPRGVAVNIPTISWLITFAVCAMLIYAAF